MKTYPHGGNERQQAIADVLSRQASAQLGRVTRSWHSGVGQHHDCKPAAGAGGA